MRSPMIYGMRAALKLSQSEVAKELHLSRATYNKKENNIELLTFQEIQKLMKIFNKSYDELFKDLV